VIGARDEMADLQSEILFVAKFGGLLASFFAYYFWIVKPMAIFNERQKQNKKDIEDLKKMRDEFTTLKAEHDMNSCKRRKK
jgi:F0F1-type ATP synthase membrane subunit b/b'